METTMKIVVKLFASFRDGRFKEEQQEFQEGITLGRVVSSMGITEADIGMTLVNGLHASMDRALREGDTISLFPMLSGG